jgi:hypothetical protein
MNRNRTGVTQLGAFETVVADDDVVQIAMLEYHARFANRDTIAAIGAVFYKHNVSTVLATIDCVLEANLQALSALGADPGFVYPRLREMCFDFQGSLFGISLLIMADSANLHTQAAPAALCRYYLNSFYFHNVLDYLLHFLIYLAGNPDGGHEYYRNDSEGDSRHPQPMQQGV